MRDVSVSRVGGGRGDGFSVRTPMTADQSLITQIAPQQCQNITPTAIGELAFSLINIVHRLLFQYQ